MTYILNYSVYLFIATQRFIEYPINQTVVYGNIVDFNCLSYGIPPPEVFWYFSSKNTSKTSSITGSDRHILHQNGTLTIQSVSYFDEGTYICGSSNAGLLRNASAFLEVYG